MSCSYQVWGEKHHCCHRGGSGDFGPENTMFNFRRCVWEFNTQIIEIDLALTKDEHLVIIHDERVDRTTNGKGLVKELTLEELKKLDAAYHYAHLKDQNITIPTFKEFLDEFIQEPNLVFFLDFKDEDSVIKAMQIVNERNIEDRIIVGAVSPAINQLLGFLKSPAVPITSDTTGTLEFVMQKGIITGELRHNIIGYIFSPATMMFFSPDLVTAAHALGCKFAAVGSPLDFSKFQKQCIDWGIDLILTDRPDVLAETMTYKSGTKK
jgi:glycerophosphoryl diester phosphodiesterase